MPQKILLTDPLTGLYTRSTLPLRLQEEAERAGRYQESFSVLVIDLDYFKSINDAFGHTRGDLVLVEFAQYMQDMLRGSDILYRYGGDEFVLLLPKTNKQQSIALATRMLQSISTHPFPGNPPLNLSLSLGIATFPEDGLIPEEIFEKADLRCYASKRDGRGRFTAEESSSAPNTLFHESNRLIERDQELQVLTVFLNRLGETQRGTFQIEGPNGSGRTFFLTETSKLARLQGYEVLSLHCSPALRSRYYGALAEACIMVGQPAPSGTPQEFEQQMAQRLVEKDRTGLFLVVDNLQDADFATEEMLAHLLLHSNLLCVGLAYTYEQMGATREIKFGELSLIEKITLHPLTHQGVHIWLRSCLQWDPPAAFSGWLHQETEGLPASLRRSTPFIFHRSVLKKIGTSWALRPDFASLDLKSWLSRHRRPTPNNLPANIAIFIGREYEIRQAKEILNSERLLTILGPGGMGKTRLAHQVAAELMEQYPDGVFVLPLAALQSNTPMVSALAEALSFSFSGQQDTCAQLLDYLRKKKMLLVMDNFEHILTGAHLVSEILETAPAIKIITTSRERLNLQGESLLELQGLGFQADETIQNLGRQNAIRLFVTNARRALPGFVIDQNNAPIIAQICQSVAGLPLGIELAAAWVRMLSPEEILQELKHSMDFLSSEQRDLPDRHRSLRAVFDSSWNLLAPSEQQALRRLAVFQRGFQRDAAQKITGTSLPVLSALVDKSLLFRMLPNRDRSTARYYLHEVLRQYALEKLQQDPLEAAQISEQHANYFAEFVHNRQNQLLIGQKSTIQEIDLELEEIRHAWQYAIVELRSDLCSIMVNGLSQIYRINGFYPEGKDRFQKAVEAFSRVSAENSETQSFNDFLVARLLLRRALFNLRLGESQESREALERSLPIIQASPDQTEQAHWLVQMGSLEDFANNFQSAQQYVQQALELYNATQNQAGVALCYNQIGLIAEAEGNFGQARTLLWESLIISRQLGDLWGSSRALTNLGNVECELGNLDQGKRYYQEGLEIARSLGDQIGAAILLNNIGDTAHELGDFEEARHLLWQSVQAYDQVGDRIGKILALANLGDIAIHLEDLDRAERVLSEALKISNELNHPFSEGYVYKGLGALAQHRGDPALAHHYLMLALRATATTHSPPFMFELIEQVAGFYLSLGQLTRAAQVLLFVVHSSAASSYVRELASKKIDTLKAQIDSSTWQELNAKADSQSIEGMIEEILTWKIPSPN